MFDEAHQVLTDLDAVVNGSRKRVRVPGGPCADADADQSKSVAGLSLLSRLEDALRADLALKALLQDLDTILRNPDHRRLVVNSDEVRAGGRPCDISVLRQQFTAMNEYVRSCDTAERWLSSQIDLAVERQTIPDIRTMLRDVERALRTMQEPVPSLELVREDLANLPDILGPVYSQARQACARLWVESWHILKERTELLKAKPELTDSAEPELIDSLVEWLRASVAYLHVAYVPARVQRDCYRAQIEEAGRDATQTSPEPSALQSDQGCDSDQRTPKQPGVANCHFKKEGSIWEVRFRGEHGRFSDTKAMQHLAKLLAGVNKPIEALDLYGTPAGASGGPHTRQPIADEPALADYNRKLVEIEEDLVKAKQNNDHGAQEKSEHDWELLTRQMNDTFSQRRGGRRLGSASNAGKAGDAIRKALERAYLKMQESMPLLTEHLRTCVRHDGTTFHYSPLEPAPAWDL